MRGQLLMGSDDIENRMASLGINEMIFQGYRSVEEIIKEVESVNQDSLKIYLKNHFDLTKVSSILMGPQVSELKTWLQDYDFSKPLGK